MKYYLSLALVALPAVASAQGLFDYVTGLLEFINDAVIPFIIGLAFLVVVFNIVRYFILGSTNKEGQETARAYLLYSILAFVAIIVFWGLVNLLVGAAGIDLENRPEPDIPGFTD